MQKIVVIAAFTVPLLLVTGFLGCETSRIHPAREETMTPSKTIEEVLNAHAKQLMSIPRVVGTAQGSCEDKPCIKVYVRQITPEIREQLPKVLEGYPVVPVETGEFEPLPEKDSD